jgi:hypothetical protein
MAEGSTRVDVGHAGFFINVLPGWQIEEPDEAVDGGGILSLSHKAYDVAVTTHFHAGSDSSLDELVHARRALLLENYAGTVAEESRFVLSGTHYRIASLAKYVMTGDEFNGVAWVLTCGSREGAVEMIGFATTDEGADLTRDLLWTLRADEGASL